MYYCLISHLSPFRSFCILYVCIWNKISPKSMNDHLNCKTKALYTFILSHVFIVRPLCLQLFNRLFYSLLSHLFLRCSYTCAIGSCVQKRLYSCLFVFFMYYCFVITVSILKIKNIHWHSKWCAHAQEKGHESQNYDMSFPLLFHFISFLIYFTCTTFVHSKTASCIWER